MQVFKQIFKKYIADFISEWEKIIANEATDKELISKLYKQLLQLISNSKNGPKN